MVSACKLEWHYKCMVSSMLVYVLLSPLSKIRKYCYTFRINWPGHITQFWRSILLNSLIIQLSWVPWWLTSRVFTMSIAAMHIKMVEKMQCLQFSLKSLFTRSRTRGNTILVINEYVWFTGIYVTSHCKECWVVNLLHWWYQYTHFLS